MVQKKLPLINSAHGSETRNIINEIIKAVNDRGLEILSESGFLTWLDENGIKHRGEVARVSDLPSGDSLNTVRGVEEDNKIYIKKENGWLPFQSIDISKINNVEDQVEDMAVNIKKFGAVGDGVADDTQAIKNALNVGSLSRLYFPEGIYRLTDSIYKSVDNDLELYGHNSELIFDLDIHSAYGLQLELNGNHNIKINSIKIDGNKMVNRALEILNETNTMENVPNILIINSEFKNVKRNREFPGGDSIQFRGGFENVTFYNVKCLESEMPEGQGISGSQGVTGITTTSFSENSYIKNVIVEKCHIEDIYSSDNSYTADQDGLKCLAPTSVETSVTIKDTIFINCHGRFVKTQTMKTYGDGCTFINNHTMSNGVFESQYGGGIIQNSKFIYDNGRTDMECSIGGSSPNIRPPSFNIKNIDVILENGSKLDSFHSTYPRNGYIGTQNIENVNIYGTAKSLTQYRINGQDNTLNVSNVFIEKLDSYGGRTLSLIQVLSSGGVSPYLSKVNVSNVTYQSNEKPLILLDRISGVIATGVLSSYNMVGFKDDKGSSGLRSGIVKSNDGDAYSQIKSFALEAEEEKVFNVNNSYGAMITIMVGSNIEGFIQLYSYGTASRLIDKGSNFELGESIEPETGVYKVWFPESRKIAIKNNGASRRTMSMFVKGNI